jgi:uncharacterized protein YndB with AHSA1/START domain
MSGRSIIHDTFAIERSYLAIPSRVFAAFASTDAKSNWRWIDRLAEDDGAVAAEFDFRIGGRERFGFKRHGTAFRYDARYYDIVPDQRIIYSYEFYADDARISVSVATIEFVMNGDGTALTWTEQGAFLDGFDGNEAPGLRREGTAILLDHLPQLPELRRPRLGPAQTTASAMSCAQGDGGSALPRRAAAADRRGGTGYRPRLVR